MHESAFISATEAWRLVLGSPHVLTGRDALQAYADNAGGLTRTLRGVLRPANTGEVVAAVRIANEFKIPLHPVSLGKNWGMGSRLPVHENAVVVDLARMNRIISIDPVQRVAVVEPGVTQGQLCAELKARGLRLRLNVTGSSADTSLVGNALDRGVGYLASRVDEISGLEVVLGNGQLIRTGFGHFPGARMTHAYPHGIGPDLNGLFFQSNFGIVTAAGMALMPAPQKQTVMIARLADRARLGEFIAALAELREQGSMPTVAHVANRNRSEIAMAPLLYEQIRGYMPGDDAALKRKAEQMLRDEGFGPWSAVGAIPGTAGQVRDARRRIRRRLRGLAQTIFLDDFLVRTAKSLLRPLRFIRYLRNKEALLLATEPFFRLAGGEPTSAALKSVYWPLNEWPRTADEDPDQSPCGLLFTLPILPATAPEAQAAVECIERVFASHGFTPYITLNLMNSRALETVINMAFDKRQPERVAAAHACNEELTAEFIRQGYIPYRVGIQSMGQVVHADDPFWQTVRDLKKVLDPNHIISPGRYNLV